MEPEERELLQRVLKLSEQNNRMLRSMRRSAMIGRLFHVFYWLIIIGLTVVSYYVLQPYIGTMTSLLDTASQFTNGGTQ